MESFHGEAKTCHGLARAIRRGLANLRIQAFLTAAATNQKRPAAALLAVAVALLALLSATWHDAVGQIAAMAVSPGVVRSNRVARR